MIVTRRRIHILKQGRNFLPGTNLCNNRLQKNYLEREKQNSLQTNACIFLCLSNKVNHRIHHLMKYGVETFVVFLQNASSCSERQGSKVQNSTLQREKRMLPGASSGPRTATIALIRRPMPWERSIHPLSSPNKMSKASPNAAQ